MKLTFLTFHKDTEQTDELSLEVAHAERDSPDFLTIYAEELNGKTHYIVLDQEVLDVLKAL
jgi:hypothetical protein